MDGKKQLEYVLTKQKPCCEKFILWVSALGEGPYKSVHPCSLVRSNTGCCLASQISTISCDIAKCSEQTIWIDRFIYIKNHFCHVLKLIFQYSSFRACGPLEHRIQALFGSCDIVREPQSCPEVIKLLSYSACL